ncbi:MAG TPA: histidine kinase [Chitinophagaceae bacterium]|nr:histidine kinase [Chitinophagaceae bacterium]
MSSSQINIPWLLVAGTVVMLVMVFAIIFFIIIHQRKVIQLQLELQKEKEKKQNQLLEATLESQEIERKRIAAELHDDVGTLLSAVKLYLNSISPSHLNDASKADTLSECRILLDDTIQTVRNLSSNLQPSSIRDFGLETTLQHFCDKLNHSSSLHVSLTAEDAPAKRMPPEHELATYRIIQELTNNILKHASAKKIHYCIKQHDNKILQVLIEHDGNGLSQAEFESKLYNIKGLGLKNIQNRLTVLGGTIHFEKTDNLSNIVSVQIPLND